ncbi:MAG: magnesium transporter [Gammaproteobacteria bacterium]|jgi:magnesium transporter
MFIAVGELMQEYYEGQIMASAGMDENEDLFSALRKSTKTRAIWLGINLLNRFFSQCVYRNV